MSEAPLIQLDDVHVTLPSSAGPVHILRGLTFNVSDGETVGLVGPSGSGKSTLLMVLAGLEKPTEGQVQISGIDIGGLSEDGLAVFRRKQIGIVFQSFHLIPTMTALENVAVPLELARQEGALDIAAERLAAVGLDHRTGHYPGQLSGGEQQRVALARAMAGSPKVILADEPTGNLDGNTGHQIIDLLFDLHDRSDTTLFLITHDEELAGRCDRIIRLRDGQIVSDERTNTHVKETVAS